MSGRLGAVLERGLEEDLHAVDIVGDGREGLALRSLGVYDAIVPDVMLPGLDGFAVARRLRARGVNTPILMLTARDAVDDRVTGLDSGADDYLVKPFAFRELLARLRALLRRDAASKDPTIRVGDLEVDTVRRRVTRAGCVVELTSKEYAVLEFLVRHPDHVLSRTQIAEHVWDYDFSALSNVVDVYIRNLRRELDDPFERKLIHTVRGSAYRLRRPPQ